MSHTLSRCLALLVVLAALAVLTGCASSDDGLTSSEAALEAWDPCACTLACRDTDEDVEVCELQCRDVNGWGCFLRCFEEGESVEVCREACAHLDAEGCQERCLADGADAATCEEACAALASAPPEVDEAPALEESESCAELSEEIDPAVEACYLECLADGGDEQECRITCGQLRGEG